MLHSKYRSYIFMAVRYVYGPLSDDRCWFDLLSKHRSSLELWPCGSTQLWALFFSMAPDLVLDAGRLYVVDMWRHIWRD